MGVEHDLNWFLGHRLLIRIRPCNWCEDLNEGLHIILDCHIEVLLRGLLLFLVLSDEYRRNSEAFGYGSRLDAWCKLLSLSIVEPGLEGALVISDCDDVIEFVVVQIAHCEDLVTLEILTLLRVSQPHIHRVES